MTSIFLKAGREKTVLQRRPWIFSGAVDHLQGTPQAGETVAVRSAQGDFLAWAAYSPQSQICARLWSYDEEETVNADFLRRRLQQALAARQALLPLGAQGALRLVHAESDGLPGWVVDRYADQLVVQCLSAGAEIWLQTLVDLLTELTGLSAVYERSDVDVRRLEGLEPRVGVLRGAPPPERIEIDENGLRFLVDVYNGHKTGFYLDQRRNRQRVRELVAGRRVLNCFCYTGAFSTYALAGGAQEVISVDTSADALAFGAQHLALNGLQGPATWMEGDVFSVLRRMRDEDRHFDAIILDPPKFAPTAALVEKAARGYKDINLLAFKLLNPGGLLFTFSCSGGVTPDLFQKIVAGAALDAQVDALIVEHLAQGPDHPVALNFPEGAYLKGLICRVAG